MAQRRIIIIGAGIGGLVSALLLAHAGFAVTVCERAGAPGGKLRQVAVGGEAIDAGPTVFTMRDLFERIFADVGADIADHLQLEKQEILARHAWKDGSRLDLYADAAASQDAIGVFAGAQAARGFAAFSARAQAVYETLNLSFMQAQRPGLMGLARNAGLSKAGALLRISPFASLWRELGHYFTDPRLRQLFGRYATYSGASPFTAPATLMLIAHVEQLGVWRIAGGMHRLAQVLAQLASAQGAVFRYNQPVAEISTNQGAASGVILADGTRLSSDIVIANADVAALAGGLFGAAAARAVGGARALPPRSLSALTWSMKAAHHGFPLSHHNVFFGDDYEGEFAAIARGALPPDPTIYICHQGGARLFCLVNAPATGDAHALSNLEIARCQETLYRTLAQAGLAIEATHSSLTGPAEFATMFPQTGGALYGRALTGWRDPFARPGARSLLKGLYLSGGSVHPGPGLPMAAMSGRLAAARIIQDYASTSR
jgi:1-hydroxycarotenoid 3,4-desaturase